MRGAIVGSGLIHVMLLVALFYMRTPASLVIPGPEVVQVSLIDPTAVTPVDPPQVEAPPPEPKPAEVKPVEDTGVKLVPPVRKKKKPPKPRDEEPPRREMPALPSAAAGPAGLRGDVAVEARDFEFTYYLVLLRNTIAARWAPPAGLATGGRRVRAVVYFTIARGGEVTAVRMEEASGLEFFDRSALRAVMLSDPLPPLPFGFGGGELGVHFGFDWEAP